MVNGWFPGAPVYGFEMVDAAQPVSSRSLAAINRIFTANQFGRIFRDFSADLLQCRYFRFIDRC